MPNILEAIRQYVVLEQSGDVHKGRCPFHREQTPSFHVHETRGIFHCFGCGAHGDADEFMRRLSESMPQV